MPGIDYEAIKLQEQAMRSKVLQRAKDHPGKSISAQKLLAIFVSVFAVLTILLIIWK